MKGKMKTGRIRIKLRAYDHRLLDSSCQKILQTALMSGAKVVGPIPLPTKHKKFVVTISPHTDKDAREHFQLNIHSRLIDVYQVTERTIDSLMHMELPAGVDIEIKT